MQKTPKKKQNCKKKSNIKDKSIDDLSNDDFENALRNAFTMINDIFKKK